MCIAAGSTAVLVFSASLSPLVRGSAECGVYILHGSSLAVYVSVPTPVPVIDPVSVVDEDWLLKEFCAD